MDRPKNLVGDPVSLREGQDCAIRFIQEGYACAFTSKVIEWDVRSQVPCVRLAWPKEIKSTAFRKFERLALQVPCTIKGPGAAPIEGELRDISLGGAGVFVQEPRENETRVKLSFVLPDGAHVKSIQAIVRNCTVLEDGHLMGCEFGADQGCLESDIAFYIRLALGRQGRHEHSGEERPMVLVIDADPESCGRLRRKVESADADIQLAGNALDGIYKLRAAAPAIVVINSSLPDLNGVELCKLIKRSEACHGKTVFLFGGSEQAPGADPSEFGISAYFPEGEKMLPNLTFALGEALLKLA